MQVTKDVGPSCVELAVEEADDGKWTDHKRLTQ
jgi:hypothetical protein